MLHRFEIILRKPLPHPGSRSKQDGDGDFLRDAGIVLDTSEPESPLEFTTLTNVPMPLDGSWVANVDTTNELWGKEGVDPSLDTACQSKNSSVSCTSGTDSTQCAVTTSELMECVSWV